MLTIPQMANELSPNPKPDRLLVGFEYEIFCFERDTLKPLGYHGDRGLGAVLKEVARLMSGEIVPGNPANKVRLPGDRQISLEPGGQFEFSSAPASTFGDLMAQFHEHLEMLEELRQRFDLHYFYGGTNPIHTVDEIGLVIDNPRYRIMNDYYPRVGKMGRRMMRQTASIQVTFNFPERRLGEQLLRAALFLGPVAAGLFAHSPYIDGKRTPYRSMRLPIWADTDPARAGLLPGFSELHYGFEDYVRHVVQAPLFFLQGDGGPDDLVDPQGMTFAEFNQRGLGDRRATLADFALHNSTIFTDARAKQTVEVRSVDGQEPPLFPSVLAMLCGLLMCEGARTLTLERLSRIPEGDYPTLREDLDRRGLSGAWADQSYRELFGDLLELATRGLHNCFSDGDDAGEQLAPIRDMLAQGKTPADVVSDRFADDPLAWLKTGHIF